MRAPSNGGDGTLLGACSTVSGRLGSSKARKRSVSALSDEICSAEGRSLLPWKNAILSLAISRTVVVSPSRKSMATAQISGALDTSAARICSTPSWSMMLPLAMPSPPFRGLDLVKVGMRAASPAPDEGGRRVGRGAEVADAQEDDLGAGDGRRIDVRGRVQDRETVGKGEEEVGEAARRGDGQRR